jgi:hypothetical protein
MWTAIFERFVTDQVAFVVHAYLLGGDVMATIVIGAGILWEHGSPDVRKVADRLVIWGVVAETLCSVALFTVDEGISAAQQSKIIALEERIAPRRLTAAQCSGIVEALSSFAGKKVRVVTYVADGEGSTLGQMIGVCLIAAKIDVEWALASLLPWDGFFSGVAVSGADKEFADTIRNALATQGHLTTVAITGAFPGNEYRGPSSPEALPAMITVGVKPVEKPRFE